MNCTLQNPSDRMVCSLGDKLRRAKQSGTKAGSSAPVDQEVTPRVPTPVQDSTVSVEEDHVATPGEVKEAVHLMMTFQEDNAADWSDWSEGFVESAMDQPEPTADVDQQVPPPVVEDADADQQVQQVPPPAVDPDVDADQQVPPPAVDPQTSRSPLLQ